MTNPYSMTNVLFLDQLYTNLYLFSNVCMIIHVVLVFMCKSGSTLRRNIIPDVNRTRIAESRTKRSGVIWLGGAAVGIVTCVIAVVFRHRTDILRRLRNSTGCLTGEEKERNSRFNCPFSLFSPWTEDVRALATHSPVQLLRQIPEERKQEKG